MVGPRFVTLTFKNACKYVSIKKLFRDTIVGLIKQLQQSGKWRLVAELTSKGDLHYHIMITPIDEIKLKVLCHYWQKTYGYVDNQKQGEVGVGKELYTSRLRLFVYLRKDSNSMPDVLGLPNEPQWKIMTDRYYKVYLAWFKYEKNKEKKLVDQYFDSINFKKHYLPIEA